MGVICGQNFHGHKRHMSFSCTVDAMKNFQIFRAYRCLTWCIIVFSMFVDVKSLSLEKGVINDGSRVSLSAQTKFIPSKINGNFATDMISGAIARACAQIVVFPVDCIKTRLQARGTSAGLLRFPTNAYYRQYKYKMDNLAL